MKRHAQTIQIFLPQGEPRGLRVADITTRIIQVAVVPRTHIGDVDRPELNRAGLYMLFGDSVKDSSPAVYIGEAEDCLKRVKQHTRKKDFWTTAVIATSKTDTLTKAHGRYLEWLALRSSKESGRYILENASVPNEPHVTEPQKAEIQEVFESTAILLSTLGFPVFEPVAKRTPSSRTFHFKRKGFAAEGLLAEDGFVVFKDSTASAREYPSTSLSLARLRSELLESGILEVEGDVLRFSSDHLFTSPSAAGSAINGHNVNGWRVWRTAEGQTLSDVYRS